MKKKPIVSVNITSPETIFEDIRISLESSNFKEEIKKQFDTILKINTSNIIKNYKLISID